MAGTYRGSLPFALTLLLAGAVPALAAEPTAPPPPPGPTDPVLPGGGPPAAPLTPVASPGAYTLDSWPLELTLRPVVLGTGMFEIRGDLFIGLNDGAAGEPFAITPAVYYGLSEQLTLGIFRDAICFNCSEVVDSLGFDAIFALLQQSDLSLAVRGSLVAESFNADFYQLWVGVLGKYIAGRLAIQFDPKLIIGLSERTSNKEVLTIPVDVQYQIDQMLAVVVTTGISGYLDGFFDYLQIPLGLGAHYTVNRQLDVGGQFIFLNLFGHTPAGGQFDQRALQLFVNYRM